MADAKLPTGGRVVRDPVGEFKVDLPAVRRFAERATLVTDADLLPWLHPDNDAVNHVVVSVDPAGGGVLSDEAFVVFLVHSNRFALLGARLVRGHDRSLKFSSLPTVFVLSLLATIESVQTMLRETLRSINAQLVFKMPRVVLLIEDRPVVRWDGPPQAIILPTEPPCTSS